jgi:hypothetical protein
MVQVSASPTASISPPDPPPVDASPGSSSESDEQYEHLQKQWRAESAIAREKAERTRETYVAIREREERERKKREPSTSSDDGGWETVSKASRMTGVSDGDKGKAKEGSTLQLKTGPVHTPSPADVRDLTAGEGVGGEGLHALEVGLMLAIYYFYRNVADLLHSTVDVPTFSRRQTLRVRNTPLKTMGRNLLSTNFIPLNLILSPLPSTGRWTTTTTAPPSPILNSPSILFKPNPPITNTSATGFSGHQYAITIR